MFCDVTVSREERSPYQLLLRGKESCSVLGSNLGFMRCWLYNFFIFISSKRGWYMHSNLLLAKSSVFFNFKLICSELILWKMVSCFPLI